jgi:succinoglycan biosynthesis transport protein ExoP
MHFERAAAMPLRGGSLCGPGCVDEPQMVQRSGNGPVLAGFCHGSVVHEYVHSGQSPSSSTSADSLKDYVESDRGTHAKAQTEDTIFMVQILNMLFRAKRLILITFALVLVCVLAFVAFRRPKYEAQMSFLVRNERADPLVSADPHPNTIQHGEVTEEDINSEVELLSSTQLLQEVVRACGLAAEFEGNSDKGQGAAVERATRKLSKSLTITPVRKSSVINVSYRSADREQSVAVLNKIATLYLQKHTKLHTGGTAASFFRSRSSDIEKQLQDAENQRARFLEDNGYTLLPEQKDLMVRQLLEVSGATDDVGASLAETQSRLRQVRAQQNALTTRIVTQDRVSANQYSVERLNTMLVDLQNRRTELVTKFRPDDRLVTEVDKEISDTRASLARAEQSHFNDETTDVNPLRQSLDAEADHLLQTQAGLVSRKSDLDAQLIRKRAELAKIEQADVYVEDLSRDIKDLETNLDLYRNKAVAAGIADALDTAKISNVVVAGSPIVPVLPMSSNINIFTGVLLAAFISLALGLFTEMHSKKLYGPAMLEAETGLQVLATLGRSSA